MLAYWLSIDRRTGRRTTITASWTSKEQERFHNLLKLAADSPYEGERTAALAAAERLVAKHGMTLDEAAQRQAALDAERAAPQPTAAEQEWAAKREATARHFREAELRRKADKARWQQAWEEARARGLDEEPAQPKARPTPNFQQPRSRRRRNPVAFARTLLTETRLSLQEIADITQLDMYQVVGLKLKLRDA